MGKVKKTTSEKLNGFVTSFGKGLFTTDGKILMCKVCEKFVTADRHSQVQQHVETSKHKDLAKRRLAKTNPQTQSLLTAKGNELPTAIGKQSQFNVDLCAALVAADIPLYKLETPVFRGFLEKYTNEVVPNRTTLSKTYVPMLYKNTITTIRDKVAGKKLWISIDETRDALNRAIGNVVIGIMEPEKPEGSIFLLTSEVLEQTNHTTIARLFNSALSLLWPDGIQHDNILLFLSDGVAYMLKAGRGLKVLYPKMLHLTCQAHALNLVAEEVRFAFTDINQLISNVKKVFLKAPTRIERFHELAADLPLPPQPVLTRWGTWLRAAMYYSNNFEKVAEVIRTFDPEDAVSIRIALDCLDKPNIREQLAYISANFACVESSITKLEKQYIPLVEQLDIVQRVQESLNNSTGLAAASAANKMRNVLSKNPGHKTISTIGKILQGDATATISSIEEEYTVEEVVAFKFAPTTSCDVERSFSRYKSLLRDNRQSFTFENLKMIFVSHCNS